jgi:hypothetical protein
MGKKFIVNNACDLFVRFFYTLSTQAQKDTAGAQAQGQFCPSITRTGHGRHHLLSLLYKGRKKNERKKERINE